METYLLSESQLEKIKEAIQLELDQIGQKELIIRKRALGMEITGDEIDYLISLL